MGTLRDLDLDEAGDHPAPQRRPAIFFMIHQYLLFLSFDAGGPGSFTSLHILSKWGPLPSSTWNCPWSNKHISIG